MYTHTHYTHISTHKLMCCIIVKWCNTSFYNCVYCIVCNVFVYTKLYIYNGYNIYITYIYTHIKWCVILFQFLFHGKQKYICELKPTLSFICCQANLVKVSEFSPKKLVQKLWLFNVISRSKVKRKSFIVLSLRNNANHDCRHGWPLGADLMRMSRRVSSQLLVASTSFLLQQ